MVPSISQPKGAIGSKILNVRVNRILFVKCGERQEVYDQLKDTGLALLFKERCGNLQCDVMCWEKEQYIFVKVLVWVGPMRGEDGVCQA